MTHDAVLKAPQWSTRWYLWDGGFFLTGRSQGVIPAHSHHAIQISIAVAGSAYIAAADGVWQTYRGAIVRPDTTHSFDGNDVVGAMFFVDPESAEGQWLLSSIVDDVTVIPDARLEHCGAAVRTFVERPLEALEVGELIRYCTRALSAGVPPSRRLDPRVAAALAAIRASDQMKISLEEAAAAAYLSASRFAHLFTQHVGLPFRRYMLWRKLTRAMVCVGRGQNIAAAAHTAGFADAAHLTRTFYQMFGIQPSVLMRGDFFEIAPPFELAVPAAPQPVIR